MNMGITDFIPVSYTHLDVYKRQVLLCLPPMIILGVFKFFFVRHIRWAAGVVALIDVVIFQTQLFYYESIWLVLFFLVIQLAITGLLSVRLYKKYYQK